MNYCNSNHFSFSELAKTVLKIKVIAIMLVFQINHSEAALVYDYSQAIARIKAESEAKPGVNSNCIPSYQDDISLDLITSPVNHDCEGTYPVTLKVSNAGTNAINTVIINWSVNTLIQGPLTYTFIPALLAGTTSFITVGTMQFNEGMCVINVTLADPNGNPDPDPSNNSKNLLLQIMPGPSIQNVVTPGSGHFC